MDVVFDLLGDPVPDGFGKRGRPAHVPTDEKRRLVVQLLAFDWAPDRISAALAITPPTLRKHYFLQLKQKAEARARVEARLLNNLMAQSDAGSPSATEKYLKRFEKHDLVLLSEAVQARGDRKPDKLGKKEERQLAAGEISGIFAVPAAPKLN